VIPLRPEPRSHVLTHTELDTYIQLSESKTTRSVEDGIPTRERGNEAQRRLDAKHEDIATDSLLERRPSPEGRVRGAKSVIVESSETPQTRLVRTLFIFKIRSN
jgi:hypothetical protein